MTMLLYLAPIPAPFRRALIKNISKVPKLLFIMLFEILKFPL
jgi:hypothetical protein